MKVEVVKEIRFAVVMYGGVSLAIYINGVAQEFLRMVRATAITDDKNFLFGENDYANQQKNNNQADENLDEVEKSYRTLAYLLGDPLLMGKFASQIKDKESWERVQKEVRLELNSRSSVKIVRFVVDILSGSSAGGINSIYLSKALVSGQDINSLQELWIKEGDFSALLNDENSLDKELLKETEWRLSKEPASLFNSQRMYMKLLEAFEKMDAQSPLKPAMIDEVDLFVTLTDFWGMPIHMRLFDKIIYERNHRRRLYFKYRKNHTGNSQNEEINDFVQENYPFLAYAARCTSSFPVAFEPMKLSDTAEIFKTLKKERRMPEKWSSYFPQEKIGRKANSIDWQNRVFVDGGTLDNKPFGYAIEAISKKQADVLIDRKLIYIEPKPDLDGGNERIGWTHRPNALKNALDIVTALPSYETIREDLQKVLERNRLIGKVNHLVSNARKDEYDLLNLVKDDLRHFLNANALLNAPRQNKAWAKLTLAEVAKEKGQAVYPYYRLRLSALTDDLARMSTRRAGIEDTSDDFLAIRNLVRAWRLKYYNRDENPESVKTTPNSEDENPENENTILSFLYQYDFNYRLRRLRFVLQEADRLLAAIDRLKTNRFSDLDEKGLQNDKFAGDLRRRYNLTRELRKDRDFQNSLASENAQKILRQKFPLIEEELFQPARGNEVDVPIIKIFEAEKDELRMALREFKRNSYRHLKELEYRQQLIETRLIDNDLPKSYEELNKHFADVAEKLTPDDLTELLGKKNGQVTMSHDDIEAGGKVGARILERNNNEIEKDINQIAKVLREIYNGGKNVDEDKSLFGKVRHESEQLFAVRKNKMEAAERGVRLYLRHFYNNFDNYDQMIFPITYETPVGEGSVIEVARVSPADSVNLINEVKSKKKKLAGDTFFSFSAFFRDDWRKNDIMWGRLDAAERLVKLVTGNTGLNQTQITTTVVTEIQRSILKDNSSFLTDGGTKKIGDYVDFIRNDFKTNRQTDKKETMLATARALAVMVQVMRSSDEINPHKNGSDAFSKFLKLLRNIFGNLINAVGRMIQISSSGLMLKNILSFFASPFSLGYLSILLPILIIPLLVLVWIASFIFLEYCGILENLPVQKTDVLWFGGVIFIIGGFYIVLLSLMFILKNFIFNKLTEAISEKSSADETPSTNETT